MVLVDVVHLIQIADMQFSFALKAPPESIFAGASVKAFQAQ